MTQEELILFKELIKEAVKSAVKDAVKEELEASFKKDLKEVKVLLAKSIKESMAIKEQTAQPRYQYEQEAGGALSGEVRKKLREAIGGDFTPPAHTQIRSNPVMPHISEEQGMQMSVNGALPDIDAPIPFIKKDSIVWKEMKERIG